MPKRSRSASEGGYAAASASGYTAASASRYAAASANVELEIPTAVIRADLDRIKADLDRLFKRIEIIENVTDITDFEIKLVRLTSEYAEIREYLYGEPSALELAEGYHRDREILAEYISHQYCKPRNLFV